MCTIDLLPFILSIDSPLAYYFDYRVSDGGTDKDTVASDYGYRPSDKERTLGAKQETHQ